MCPGDRETTCFSRPRWPTRQFLDFLVEKNHTYRFFHSQNSLPLHTGRDDRLCVCVSDTHLPYRHRHHFLRHRPAGQGPTEQGFHGHWVTRNLSSAQPSPHPLLQLRLTPSHLHRCMQRDRGSLWGLVNPEGCEGRSVSL